MANSYPPAKVHWSPNHPITKFWISNAGAGVVDGIEAAKAVFHAAYAVNGESLPLVTGTPPATSPHTASIYAPDFEGVYREFGADLPVWKWGRVVNNIFPDYSENIVNDIPTQKSNANLITYQSIEFTGSGYLFYRPGAGTIGSTGMVLTVSLDVTGGTIGKVGLAIWASSIETVEIDTAIPARYTFEQESTTDAELKFGFDNRPQGGPLGTVEFTNVQWEMRTATGIPPSKFSKAPIDSYPDKIPAVYATTNGNTVVDNVVTEAQGTPLSPLPMLVSQDAGTNSLLQSRNPLLWTNSTGTSTFDQAGITGAPSTASKVVETEYSEDVSAATDGQPYTLKVWVKKTSVTGNVAVQVNGVNDVRSLILEPSTGVLTSSGTQAFTSEEVIDADDWWIILGSVVASAPTTPTVFFRPDYNFNSLPTMTEAILGQFEVHANKALEDVRLLGPIFTTDAPASTDAVINAFPEVNHSSADGPYYVEVFNKGDDEYVLAVSGVQFLTIVSDIIVLNDGVNSVSMPLIAGENKIGVVFDATQGLMALNANGAWSADTTYDGTLGGTGDLTFDADERNVRRWDETDLQAQKDIIDGEMSA